MWLLSNTTNHIDVHVPVCSQLFGGNHFLCDFYRQNLHGEQSTKKTNHQPASHSKNLTKWAGRLLKSVSSTMENGIIVFMCLTIYGLSLWRFVRPWIVPSTCVRDVLYCHGGAVVKGVYGAALLFTLKHISYARTAFDLVLCVIFGVCVWVLSVRNWKGKKK